MSVAILNKVSFLITGAAEEFLKGLSSNLSDAPKNSFLDAQGKVVAVVDQVRLGSQEVLILVEAPFAERLEAHLQKYLLISDCVLCRAPEWRAYYDLEGNAAVASDDVFIPQKIGRILITRRLRTVDVTPEEFRLFRVRHALPLQGIDYDREMLLNLNDENLVSYSKGCFLGQEIIARVHYRAKPPKALVARRVSELGPAEVATMTSRVSDPQTGEDAGFVFLPNR